MNLSPTGKILVIGGKSTNFRPEFRNHPRLVFWGCLNHGIKSKAIPVNVEMILFTRFIKHKIREQVEKMAIQSGVNFDRMCKNTGEINRLFSQILAPEEAPKEEQTPEKTTITTPVKTLTINPEIIEEENMETEIKIEKGRIVKFVRENANLEAPPTAEIKRLYGLIKEQGVITTENTISATFHKLKRKITSPSSSTKTTKRSDSIEVLKKFLDMFEIVAVALSEVVEENAKLAEANRLLEEEMLDLKKIKALVDKIKS